MIHKNFEPTHFDIDYKNIGVLIVDTQYKIIHIHNLPFILKDNTDIETEKIRDVSCLYDGINKFILEILQTTLRDKQIIVDFFIIYNNSITYEIKSLPISNNKELFAVQLLFIPYQGIEHFIPNGNKMIDQNN
jgi:hypothetical protein